MTTDRDDELADFARLVEAYGAAPGRWPAERRRAAETLLARSAAARALAAEAAALDAALARLPPPAAPAALIGRVLAAAPASRAAKPAQRSWWLGGFWRPATGLAAAAVLGVGLGVFGPAFPSFMAASSGEQETVWLDGGISVESEL